MRVSFTVRQLLRLLTNAIAHNVERLSYAQTLRTRKLVRLIERRLSLRFLEVFGTDCRISPFCHVRVTIGEQIRSIPANHETTGYVISSAEELLNMFDADACALVIGDAAKVVGPTEHSREVLAIGQYLRIKQFECVPISHSPTDYSIHGRFCSYSIQPC